MGAFIDDNIYVASLFANAVPDPVRISLEYLAICREHPDTVTVQIAQMHVRHFVEFQWYVFLTTLAR